MGNTVRLPFNEECPVCMEGDNEVEGKLERLVCNHVAHYSCFNIPPGVSSCPYCRGPLQWKNAHLNQRQLIADPESNYPPDHPLHRLEELRKFLIWKQKMDRIYRVVFIFMGLLSLTLTIVFAI